MIDRGIAPFHTYHLSHFIYLIDIVQLLSVA